MRKIMASLIIAAVSISLLASLTHAQDVYTDNVVIVLDASGSMNESMRDAQNNKVRKIDAAKTALYEVLKQIPDTTHVGVLVFSAGGIRDEWVYPLGKKDEAKLRKAINMPEPGDGTPLGTFMKIGADRLLQEREKQHNYGSYRLLVVTDGEANQEPSNRVDKYTLDIISRGITLDVIGVAMASKHTLATKSHSYRTANDPASLKKAIQEVFAEVSVKDKSIFAGSEFDDLSGISPEVAMVIINALSSSGNQPIGEKPKPKPAPEQVSPAQPVQPSTQPSAQPVAPPITQQDEGIRLLLCCAIPLAVVIVVLIIIGIVALRRK